MESNKHILITVDVEDWFQVENFKPWIPFSSWSSYELRVEKNTHRLLDLFDSHIQTRNPIKATFFVLGWLAERLPSIVRQIHSRGHEVASHGYSHRLCNEQDCGDFQSDLEESKNLLEDIIGAEIYGYRAPSFSIDDDSLKIVEACGYLYDSSYNSFKFNKRYGRLNCVDPNSSICRISPGFYELSISNLVIGSRAIPWGGGGYFRLFPFRLFAKGVRFILNRQQAYVFYMHPWEIDPEQPRVKNASFFYKFRHYVNLSKTQSKLTAFFKNFNGYEFTTCLKYLDQSMNGN